DLGDVWADIRTVGAALGVGDVARSLTDRAIERLTGLRAATAPLSHPTVATIEWIDPLMADGNWMPELIETAGGRILFGTAGEHSPCLDWSALVVADPEFILVTPCGFRIERSVAELALLSDRPEWRSLRAVQHG